MYEGLVILILRESKIKKTKHFQDRGKISDWMNIGALQTGKQENNSPVSKRKQTHIQCMEALFSS